MAQLQLPRNAPDLQGSASMDVVRIRVKSNIAWADRA